MSRSATPALAGTPDSGRFWNIALWALAAAIAFFLATLLNESAVFGGEYIPRTNDSLYHARRILDAAIGDRGLYQFDNRLHVPEGTWIPWPWAYDYLLAQLLKVALWIDPSVVPMTFLAYVPAVWVVINMALLAACTSAVGLPVGLRAVALLAFACSPLIQLYHATAMLDHHYVELSFILLSVWLGMRWLQREQNVRDAMLLGIALGVAPAFHNGLFVLQLPLLAAVCLIWIRSGPISQNGVLWLGVTLIVSTLLAALPSEPLRAGMFEFALHSWFHVYVAVCTAVALYLMGLGKFSIKSGLLLIGVSALLAAPIVTQAVRGAMFIGGNMSNLDLVSEVKSPFAMLTTTPGVMETASLYSWLIVTVPLSLIGFTIAAFRSRAPSLIYFSIWAVFGLWMLLMQYRLHYFGQLFIVLGPLLLLDLSAKRFNLAPAAVLLCGLVGFLLLYQPPLRERLFTVYAISGDYEYEVALPAFEHLRELCREEPGIVLANSNDGNAILYHTDCSVFVNNFIMRPQDEQQFRLVRTLLGATPEAVLGFEPRIDYMFLRASDFLVDDDGPKRLSDRYALARELLATDEMPNGFEATRTMLYESPDTGELAVFGKVFKLTRGKTANGAR